MEKIYTYMMITTLMMLVLNLFGFASSGFILDSINVSSPDSLNNFQTSFFFAYMGTVALVAMALLVVVSIVTRSVSDLPISAALATAILITFITDMVSVVGIATEEWEKLLLLIIMSTYVMGYGIALYDWVRGKD